MAIVFKTLMALTILITAPLPFAQENPTCEHTKDRFNCVKYLKNYDGDTITFDIPNVHPLIGKNISIRVSGVDTAEVRTQNQCEKTAGRTARKLVTSLLKNSKRVDLTNISRDKYFRIVADVIIDNRNLKDILIKQRLAYAYDGGKKNKPDWCTFSRMPSAEKK